MRFWRAPVGADARHFSVFLFNKGIVSNFIHINLAWILSVAALFAFKYFLLEKDRRLIKIFFQICFKDVLDEILDNPESKTWRRRKRSDGIFPISGFHVYC